MRVSVPIYVLVIIIDILHVNYITLTSIPIIVAPDVKINNLIETTELIGYIF